MGVLFCFGTLSCIITCSVLPLSSILGRSPRNAWVHVVPQSSLPETAQGKRKQSGVTLLRPISRGTKFEYSSSLNSLPAGEGKKITLGRSTRFDNNNNNMLDLALNCLSHWDDWIRLLPAQETGRQGESCLIRVKKCEEVLTWLTLACLWWDCYEAVGKSRLNEILRVEFSPELFNNSFALCSYSGNFSKLVALKVTYILISWIMGQPNYRCNRNAWIFVLEVTITCASIMIDCCRDVSGGDYEGTLAPSNFAQMFKCSFSRSLKQKLPPSTEHKNFTEKNIRGPSFSSIERFESRRRELRQKSDPTMPNWSANPTSEQTGGA